MTDKEILKRIEKDADEYCKQYLPYVDTTGHWIGFQDGAKSERNKAIDECIQVLENNPGDINLVPLLESLKL